MSFLSKAAKMKVLNRQSRGADLEYGFTQTHPGHEAWNTQKSLITQYKKTKSTDPGPLMNMGAEVLNKYHQINANNI